MIALDPKLAEVFAKSTSVSSKLLHINFTESEISNISLICLIVSKGQGANMLKVNTKRRRTKQEILDKKQDT